MLHKIEKDPFYREIYLQGGDAALKEAGFFIDNVPEDLDLEEAASIPCTPYKFIEENLIGATNPCVLLATGGFAPCHSGHINMMIGAKEAAEKAGYQVVGAYIAPDHDEYIGRKINESQHYNIGKRIYLINAAIRATPWLRVDPWAGIFQKYTINFTDILLRLERYLEKNLSRKVPIFFVAGGDNAGFATTFKNQGNCIIVTRPGYESKVEKYKHLVDGKRILLGTNHDSNSSTLVRKLKGVGGEEKVELLLRFTDVYDKMEWAIYEELKKHYTNIKTYVAYTQVKELEKVTGNIISLDPLIKTQYNLAISRNYDYFGMNMLGFINRPGSLPIEEQIKNIPKGAYKLYDDDIHTGRTMDYVTNLLAKHDITIVEQVSFTKSVDGQEVLDARDFIYNRENCGLVIDGKRVPYAYPFVDPYCRASITKPMEFSKAIWQLNKQEKYSNLLNRFK